MGPTIVSVKELRGPGARSRTIGKDWKRTYTRAWRVVTNDPHTGPLEVTSNIPVAFGQFYANATGSEIDRGSFAVNAHTEEETEDGMQWKVTLTYEPFDPTQWPENPLEKPAEVEWDDVSYERIVDEDQNGNAVVNTAGEPFDPPVVIEDHRPTLNIVRNEAHFDPSLAYSFRNAVNTQVFYGADPGKAKISKITGRRAWDQYLSSIGQNGGFYWIVTYAIEFNEDGWHRHILNQGLRQLVGGQLQQILVGGTPITSPSLLDSSGAELPPGGTPIFLEFIVYPEQDLSALGLQNPGP